MTPTSFTLNTGASIPSTGLGTWRSPAGAVEAAVYHAITVTGVRHIDCAFAYGNEHEIGAALARVFAEGNIARSEVFVTTKLWCTWHSRAHEGFQKSLDALGLDYVDLYLMHWPVPLNPAGNHPFFPTLPDGTRDIEAGWAWPQTWAEMEKLQESGKAKAIGVSNFSVAYLKKLLETAKVVPAVNQIESHPLLKQEDTAAFCREKGILVTAYSPFGSSGGPLLQDATVAKIAEKHGVAAGSVLISFQLHRGLAVISKSVNPSRIDENAKLVDLDAEDMEALIGIQARQGTKRFISPTWPVNLLYGEANSGDDFPALL